MSATLWGAVAALIVAIGAAILERREARRANPDRIAPVSWTFVMVAALFAAIVLAGLSLHAG